MEQKIYKYEIVLNLLRKEGHLRQIAKEIGINHMTIKRALDSLVEENVLDVRVEGKNNVFSIKRTIEAENIAFASELYKFNNFLKKHPELRQELEQLRKMPAEIILIYGSYAKGTETEKSDIDIYILSANRKLKEKASKLNKKFSIQIGKYDKSNPLIKEIEKNHVVVKGVEVFYGKSGFFG